MSVVNPIDKDGGIGRGVDISCLLSKGFGEPQLGTGGTYPGPLHPLTDEIRTEILEVVSGVELCRRFDRQVMQSWQQIGVFPLLEERFSCYHRMSLHVSARVEKGAGRWVAAFTTSPLF